METEHLVRCSLENGVATVTIAREKSLNALNGEVLSELSTHLHTLSLEPANCRLLLLRGAGDRAFVAGADIKVMQSGEPDKIREFAELGQRVMREVETFHAPVVAVVHGFAFGGGMELALAADLIIASERARFGQPEVKLGLLPGFGGTQRLTLRIGAGGARRLILTGDDISAEEAFRLGIADYLAKPENLEATVSAVSASLLARSPRALTAAKRSIARLHEANELGGLNYELEQFLAVIGSADAKEGLTAFVEKRPPNFPGYTHD